MIPVAAWLIGAGIGALVHYLRSGSESEPKRYIGVGWSASLTATQAPVVARPVLHEVLLSQGGFRLFHSADHAADYFRGDSSITALPTTRPVRWREIPVFLTARYVATAAGCDIELQFAAPPTMTFDEKCAAFFHEHARGEYGEILEALRSGPWDPRSSDRNGSDPAQPNAASAADLALLGLSPGATWEQVQSAYREACKKFHPDRLSGKDLPPELIALAAKRFSEMADAYQRLKSRSAR
jgi:DnaJ domain